MEDELELEAGVFQTLGNYFTQVKGHSSQPSDVNCPPNGKRKNSHSLASTSSPSLQRGMEGSGSLSTVLHGCGLNLLCVGIMWP